MRPKRRIPIPLPGISTAFGNGNSEVYLMPPVPNAWPSNASYTKLSICVIMLNAGPAKMQRRATREPALAHEYDANANLADALWW